MNTILADNTAEVLLENILQAMDDETFGRDKAAKLVGGLGRLRSLIASGEIRAEKPAACQNGKWLCKASDVLRHCVSRKRRH